MNNFKTFSLLGLLLFALVLISSTVTADEKPKEENKAVAAEATKEMNVPDDVGKEGYGGGGGGGGGCGCCYKHGYKYCGRKCCYPQNEGTEAVSEAAADANPERHGGGYGHGGGGYGHGGGGYGGKGGGGWGGGGKGGGGGYGGGGKGGGGGYGGGGKGGGGWGGGGT